MKSRALRSVCIAGLLLSEVVMAKPSQAAWYSFLLPLIGGKSSQSQSQSQSHTQNRASNQNRTKSRNSSGSRNRMVANAAPLGTPAAKPARSGLKNGHFDGNIYDVLYGYVQVQADVSKGKLVRIDILRRPTDRRTSRIIARRALPVLEREAIRAQSARVNLVSGATLTSLGFVKSLADALNHARGTG